MFNHDQRLVFAKVTLSSICTYFTFIDSFPKYYLLAFQSFFLFLKTEMLIVKRTLEMQSLSMNNLSKPYFLISKEPAVSSYVRTTIAYAFLSLKWRNQDQTFYFFRIILLHTCEARPRKLASRSFFQHSFAISAQRCYTIISEHLTIKLIESYTAASIHMG